MKWKPSNPCINDCDVLWELEFYIASQRLQVPIVVAYRELLYSATTISEYSVSIAFTG